METIPDSGYLFEYDPAKSATNRDKHGIDFERAQTLWSDPERVETPADYLPENRILLIAELDRRMWTAVFTLRGASVRIISVRRSRLKEVRIYDAKRDQR